MRICLVKDAVKVKSKKMFFKCVLLSENDEVIINFGYSLLQISRGWFIFFVYLMFSPALFIFHATLSLLGKSV